MQGGGEAADEAPRQMLPQSINSEWRGSRVNCRVCFAEERTVKALIRPRDPLKRLDLYSRGEAALVVSGSACVFETVIWACVKDCCIFLGTSDGE